VGESNARGRALEEFAKDFLDPDSGLHEPGKELVDSVEGMVSMVGLEGLEYAGRRWGDARVVQERAVFVNRKELADLVPH
jgi:hypothetical protein